jgi:phosphatidate cytidylyltransferase
VLSALALIPLALGAAVAGGPWLAGATAAAVVAMAWEWASMSEPKAPHPAFCFALVGAIGAVMFASWGELGLGLAWAALVAAASAFRRRGESLARMGEALLGPIYIAAPCAAFLWIRGHPSFGLVATIGLFCVIWAADGAAYFSGRLIGGPRIFPGLSTNKTFAGLVGAVTAGGAAGWAYGALVGADRSAWTAAGLALSVIGMAGDLFESAIKRRFGVKDASQLIPGHGGVLDRLDGLMAATSATALALVLRPDLAKLLAGSVY